ncbi:phosphatidate cytidylyltransferase [Propionivibrio sp.]|uniref:phosphatidate cytidylyltransferase n=1 Tax=Propionivibrio sp. TaxID=2212460 RepID=UPI0025E0B104|nr:phosphatidate cytidylyltransferase [Propionivibrio sp.]MBK7356509.1 phosphatidate cytidylyltransferase [Propionivibrio sp.]MBK8745286.1 phosphatidate cytidylyltransferase [Propionivibrio sp.]MBK8894207.1 phosphatidate cytidylyltransferase [Propionivibrio sp.]
MLKTRIVTAVLLATAFLLALFYLPPLGWVIFITSIATVATWEWGGLMAFGAAFRIKLGLLFALLCVAIAILEPAALGLATGFENAAWSLGRWLYIPAAVFWLLVAPLWLKHRRPLAKSVPGLAVGLLLILPTWLASVQLRQAGAPTLISVMAVVWVADIAAYMFGRTFGRHKMAPSISPGKTWEGALGGVVAVVVYGFLLSPKMPAVLSTHYALLLPALVLLAAIGIIGDLFESLLKRQAGLKDSSNVLPGHGGVLDRIDSLTSTLPLVALVWLTNLY